MKSIKKIYKVEKKVNSKIMFQEFLKNLADTDFYKELFGTYGYAVALFFGIIFSIKILERFILKRFRRFRTAS